jgi:hypothetical protein
VRLLKEELAILLGLTTVKMLALFGYLISSVHVCSCGFWRAKLDSNTPEELEEFLLSRFADPQARRIAAFCGFGVSHLKVLLHMNFHLL